MRKSLKLAFQVQKRLDSDFSPVFICGIAGSGTTLLSAILDQNFKIAANVRESARWAKPDSAIFIKEMSDFPDLDNYLREMVIPLEIPAGQIRTESVRLYREHLRWPKVSAAVLDKAPNVHMVRAAKLHKAFPAAKFLLIVRDPISNIEGLRRKWPIFRQAKLDAVCDFWVHLHKVFIKEIGGFVEQVLPLTYSSLIQEPIKMAEQMALFLDLEEREKPLEYMDTRDLPGKGLRNVKDGKIRIDLAANVASIARFPADDAAYVLERTGDFYRELELICGNASSSFENVNNLQI